MMHARLRLHISQWQCGRRMWFRTDSFMSCWRHFKGRNFATKWWRFASFICALHARRKTLPVAAISVSSLARKKLRIRS